MLQRNTTRQETGISLRDTIVGYMQGFCSCDDINAGRQVSKTGIPCAQTVNGVTQVDPGIASFCQQAGGYTANLAVKAGSCTCLQVIEGDPACGQIDAAVKASCEAAATPPSLGRCSCYDALDPTSTACGYVTQEVKNFCEHPTGLAIAAATSDGRIGERVK